MMEWLPALIVVALSLGCAWWSMRVAEDKGLNGCVWAILGLVLGPIGLLLAMGMPRQR